MTLHLPPEKRKAQILTAFAALLDRKGFSDLTMDDVAQEAGISKGAIYHHFESKEDILLALFRTHSEDMFSAVAELRGKYPTFEEFLLEGGKVILNRSIEFFTQTEIMMHFMAYHDLRSKLHQMIMEDHYKALEIIENILKSGIESGDLVLDDPRGMASTVNALFSGLTMHARCLPMKTLEDGWVAFARLLLKTAKPGYGGQA